MSGASVSLLSAERPFPGLRPFYYEDHEYFFGRKEQIFSLYRLIDRARFVAVVGSSGSGKSSLVRAGLLPLLDREGKSDRARGWRRVEMRPGDAPLRNLASALARLAGDEDGAIGSARRKRVDYQLRSASIEDALAEVGRPGEGKLLILVDQFEELFRFAGQRRDLTEETGAREDAVRFVQLLIDASRSHDRNIVVVLTMRSDFIGECARFQELPEAVSASQYLVPSLTRDQREDVIRKPVEKAKATIEPILIQRLLNDSGNDLDQLPVLQHCLLRIWLQARRRARDAVAEGPTTAGEGAKQPYALSVVDYEAVGGMNRAMSQHADEISDTLPGKAVEIERVFRALSELHGDSRPIRRVLPFDALAAETGADESALRDVLDAFRDDDCSFLTPSKSTLDPVQPETPIDVGHEALLRRWEKLTGEPDATGDRNDRRSIGWLREERRDARRFEALVSIVENDTRGDATLDPGLVAEYSDWWARLRPTSAWADRYGGGFQAVDGLLRRSREMRQRRRRSRWLLGASAAVVLAVFALVTVYMRYKSEQDLQLQALKSANNFFSQVYTSLNSGNVTSKFAADLLEPQNSFLDQIEVAPSTEDGKKIWINLMLTEFDVFYIIGNVNRALAIDSLADHEATQLAEKRPENNEYKFLLYQTAFRFGDLAARGGDFKGALKYFEGARGDLVPLPESSRQQTYLVTIDNKMGETLQRLNRWPDALGCFHAALAITDAQIAKNSNNEEWERQRAVTFDKIGLALSAEPSPDLGGAIEAYDKAIDIQLHLSDNNTGNVVVSNLATSYLRKALVLISENKNDEALKDYKITIDIHSKLLAKDENNPIWLDFLARDLFLYANLLEKSGNTMAALTEYKKARLVRQQSLTAEPSSSRRKNLDNIQKKIADISRALSADLPVAP